MTNIDHCNGKKPAQRQPRGHLGFTVLLRFRPWKLLLTFSSCEQLLMSSSTLTLTLLFLKMHSFADLGEVSDTDDPCNHHRYGNSHRRTYHLSLNHLLASSYGVREKVILGNTRRRYDSVSSSLSPTAEVPVSSLAALLSFSAPPAFFLIAGGENERMSTYSLSRSSLVHGHHIAYLCPCCVACFPCHRRLRRDSVYIFLFCGAWPHLF